MNSSEMQLTVNQVKGEFDTKEERMKLYATEDRELMASFEHASINLVSREENALLDALSKRVALAPTPSEIFFIEHSRHSSAFTTIQVLQITIRRTR